MKIVEIKSLPNGAHRNQEGDFEIVPEGYAKIPDELETPNFPFGEIVVEQINGVMTVTKWTANEIPEIPEREKPVSKVEQLRADVDYLAIMTGVEL